MDIATCRSLPSVPLAKELVDATLSKTQRKTPTEIHSQYDVVKIRAFYTRKVRFVQQTFHDRLQKILDSFPVLDSSHPFYADLLNILYDRDHYKIALGKVNLSKSLIDNISKEYVRLLKYGDSLFRCKSLKRIAFGKMVKVIRKLDKTLIYLEEVRKHISRLPTIDPIGNTLILAGFPNVGKSSFINKISRAGVEVQPYPFTTKSLYVGQTNFTENKQNPFYDANIPTTTVQVVDTPGILDQPLHERNTIEMQAITALAHLRATIIYFIDISESCGYSIKDQVALYDNIKPLFANKPVIIALNKNDVIKFQDLSDENKQLINSFTGNEKFEISTLENFGVDQLKDRACELVVNSNFGKKSVEIGGKVDERGKLYVAVPKNKNPERKSFIPPQLLEDLKKAQMQDQPMNKADSMDNLKSLKNKMVIQNLNLEPFHPTQKDLAETLGPDYTFNEKSKYFLDESQKFDIIPEIYNGKNISDFIDPNIIEKLSALEKEELLRDRAGFYNIKKWDDVDKKAHFDREIITDLRMIAMKDHAKNKSSRTQPTKEISVKINKFNERIGQSLEKVSEDEDEVIKIPEFDNYPETYQNKLINSGMNTTKLKHSKKLIQRSRIKPNLEAKAGPGDRHVYTSRPKHLFSGKRKVGKTQWR